MSTARILIVSNGPLCRNPRVVKEATTLGHAGYDVTVLTVRDHAPSEPHDLALLEGAPYRRETVDLITGFSRERFAPRLRRLLHSGARKLASLTGIKSIHTLGPARSLLRRARRFRADLTIVHNEVPHWVGVQLLRDGRRVAADIEDWHSEDLLPEERARRPLHVLREVEKTLLARAAYTSTTSQALASALHERFGGNRPRVIANSFPLQTGPVRTAPGDPPVFFWFSQTLGPGRGLEPFFAAWSLTHHPSRVVLLGEDRSNYQNYLLAHLSPARRLQVDFLPLVPPDELPAIIARHDIGLALEQASIVNRDLTVTNKIIQYLNAGLAVVASNTAGQREVLARTPEAGVIVDTHDTAAFAAVLDSLLEDRPGLHTRQQAARRLAEEVYCWERETPRLLALVEGALARPA